MFEKATKQKLRFETPMGLLSVEDVWDLPLTSRNYSIDDLAKSLNRNLKESEEESFVAKKTKASETLSLRFDIVKHIIGVKLEEQQAKKDAASKKAKRERILEIMAKKEDESLENRSLDELKQLLEETQ